MKSLSRAQHLTLIVALVIVSCLSFYYARPYGVGGSVDAERVIAIAIEKDDILICDKLHLKLYFPFPVGVTNQELRLGCYAQYVTAHPNENVCPRVSNDINCVEALALSSGDASVCLAPGNIYPALCVSSVARKQKDQHVCDIIIDSELHTKCLFLSQ